MKKLLTTIMLVLSLNIAAVEADIIVTNMTTDEGDHEVIGSLLDEGDGYIQTIDSSFFFANVVASQETLFMDNTGSWSGVFPNTGQSFDFDDEIAGMTDNQVAVGMYWGWKAIELHGAAMLAILECISGICTGQGVPLQAGDFTGMFVSLDGTGSVSSVPILPTAWLFGSGLIGLVGLARRKKS